MQDEEEEEEEASTKSVDSTASEPDEPVTFTIGGDGTVNLGDGAGPSAGVIPDSGEAKDEL